MKEYTVVFIANHLLFHDAIVYDSASSLFCKYNYQLVSNTDDRINLFTLVETLRMYDSFCDRHTSYK